MGLIPEGSRVVGYIRVSSEEQTKGFSIDGQKDDLTDWANDEKWSVKKWYIEEGISGDHDKLDKRDKLQEMLVDAKHDNFDAILVWNLDRFSRDARDTLDILDKLKDSNVRLISADMKTMDYWSYTGRMVMTNQSAFNEFFLAQLKEKVSMGVRKKQQLGQAHGRTPFGFKRVSDYENGRAYNTRNEIHSEEIKTVKLIVDLHAQDMKYSAISRRLDELGIKPRAMHKNSKSTWNPATIRSILLRFYEKRDEYPI